jgi:hypothetical protein
MIVLADRATSEWTLEFEVSLSEIWASDTYKAAGLPEKAPVLALLHPTDPNTVYFFLEGRLFGVDMRTRVVVGCETFEPARPENKGRFSSWLVLPFEIPPASGLTPWYISLILNGISPCVISFCSLLPCEEIKELAAYIVSLTAGGAGSCNRRTMCAVLLET